MPQNFQNKLSQHAQARALQPQLRPVTPHQVTPHQVTPHQVTPHQVKPLFNQPTKCNDLKELRNKYAMRLQKGLAQHILASKHARVLFLFLELKPVFNSGVIFNDGGKIPYKKIADFIGEGISTTRKKITQLRKLKLVSIDENKNICLASIKMLPIILKLTKDENKYTKKYKLINNGDTQYTIKQIAIHENLKKQEHKVFQKILNHELLNNLIETYHNNKNSKTYGEFYLQTLHRNASKCVNYVSKNQLSKFKKYVRENFDELKAKYKNIHYSQMSQLEFGFPGINPHVTLSYNGMAKILNRKSKSSAHYQTMKLAQRGLVDVLANYCTISNKSAAVYESMCGMRTDIFSYVYNTKKTVNGKHRLYFRNCPNTIQTLTNATIL